MTEKHYPGSPPPAAAAPAPLDRALVVERLKTLANVKGCEVNARDAEYLRAAAAIIAADGRANNALVQRAERAEQRVKELETRLEKIGGMYAEAVAAAARLEAEAKRWESIASAGLTKAEEVVEAEVVRLRARVAELEASAAGGCITIAWEPENNRVVVTYDNAPSSVRVVTRRS